MQNAVWGIIWRYEKAALHLPKQAQGLCCFLFLQTAVFAAFNRAEQSRDPQLQQSPQPAAPDVVLFHAMFPPVVFRVRQLAPLHFLTLLYPFSFLLSLTKL